MRFEKLMTMLCYQARPKVLYAVLHRLYISCTYDYSRPPRPSHITGWAVPAASRGLLESRVTNHIICYVCEWFLLAARRRNQSPSPASVLESTSAAARAIANAAGCCRR